MTVSSSHPAPPPPPQGYSSSAGQALSSTSGYAHAIPTPSLPQTLVPANDKGPKPAVSLSNTSLFFIILSLMFCGALTFLGGVLFGMKMRGASSHAESLPARKQLEIEGEINQDKLSEVAHLAGTAAVGALAALRIPALPRAFDPLQEEAREVADSSLRQAAEHEVLKRGGAASGHPSHAKTAYTVHLGTFARKENANALQKRLQALNYSTYVKEDRSPDRTLYHVQSGRYESYSPAATAAKKFKRSNIPGAIVVQLPEETEHESWPKSF